MRFGGYRDFGDATRPYRSGAWYKSKKDAVKAAKNHRKAGLQIRVTPSKNPDGYILWVRGEGHGRS